MWATVAKLAGLVGAGGLSAGAIYTQVTNGDMFGMVSDPYDSVLRISAVSLATVGMLATVCEVFPRRSRPRRAAGALVTSTSVL